MNIFSATALSGLLLCACAGSGVANQAKARRAPVTRKANGPELTEAVRRGDIRAVRSMLRKGVSAKAKDDALMSAAANAHPEMVEVLLAAGANPNATFATAHAIFTPLGEAVRAKSTEVIDVLLRGGAELNPKKSIFPLYFAMERNDVAMVRELVSRGADVNLKNVRGMTALMIASGSSAPEVVKFLLDAGADVNLRDDDGKTALNIAEDSEKFYGVTEEREEIIRMLKQSGAKR